MHDSTREGSDKRRFCEAADHKQKRSRVPHKRFLEGCEAFLAWSSPRWRMSRKKYSTNTDSSETCGFVPMSARQSVHGMPVIAGSIELARRYRTSYQRPPGSHITSQERYKTTNILAFGVQAQAAEDVFEWLQPSGRRPEGCCRSTELSCGRCQLPEVADYRLRRTMHAPCMPRLTLADVWRRQPEKP